MALVRRILLVLAFTALCLPAAAIARSDIAPPGNSGVDQYLETIPDATGARPSRPAGKGAGSPLSAAARRRLEGRGRDGRVLADAIAQTAPSGGGANAGGDSAKRGRDGLNGVPHADGESPARKVAGAALGADGGGGLGVALPLILGVALLAAIALLLARRRRSS